MNAMKRDRYYHLTTTVELTVVVRYEVSRCNPDDAEAEAERRVKASVEDGDFPGHVKVVKSAVLGVESDEVAP